MDETRLHEELASIIESYQALETRLLESIASHLPFGELGGGSFEWYSKKLLELGGINRKNMQLIAAMAKTTLPQVKKAFAEIGYAAVIADDEVYNAAFEKSFLPNKPESAYLSPALRNIFLTSFALAEDKLNLTNTKALESSNKAFLNAVNSCYIEVSSGAYDYNTALRRALTSLADNKIYGATYARRDGGVIHYPIDATVRRNLMTTSNNMAVEMQFQRGDEWGSSLIEISSHMGARPLCEPFQGRIFDRSGSHPVYPDFYKETSYGEPAGIFGINCGHVPYPFIEGLSEQSFFPYPKEENDEAYKHSQEQRRLEMNVRRYKQRIVVAKASDHTDMYDLNAPKLKESERKLKDFLADSPNAQQPRVGVAKFSHSEAMKAVWADRKVAQAKELEYNKAAEDARNRIASDEFPNKIRMGQQNKHIEGTKEYLDYVARLSDKGQYGPSKLSGGLDFAAGLVQKYRGTGEPDISNSKWLNRETIKFNDAVVGTVVNNITGAEKETTVFRIHYSKYGAHVVPDYPSKKGGGEGSESN